MSDGRERDTTGEFGSGENGVDSGDEEYGGPQDRPVDEVGVPSLIPQAVPVTFETWENSVLWTRVSP